MLHILSARQRLFQIILSCKTKEQFEAAERLCENFYKLYYRYDLEGAQEGYSNGIRRICDLMKSIQK